MILSLPLSLPDATPIGDQHAMQTRAGITYYFYNLEPYDCHPAGRPDALFFAGDLGQRIFQTPFSWRALGVEIRGRSPDYVAGQLPHLPSDPAAGAPAAAARRTGGRLKVLPLHGYIGSPCGRRIWCNR